MPLPKSKPSGPMVRRPAPRADPADSPESNAKRPCVLLRRRTVLAERPAIGLKEVPAATAASEGASAGRTSSASERRPASTSNGVARSNGAGSERSGNGGSNGEVSNGGAKRAATDASTSALLAAASAAANGEQVAFNVAGKVFRVSVGLVKSYPGGVLDRLLREVGESNPAKPIFVDGNPDRFPYILDWYRSGEMYVPASVPVAAVLADARRLALPAEVIVNGASVSTLGSTSLGSSSTSSRGAGAGTAAKVCRELIGEVISQWPNFTNFLEDTLTRIAEHFRDVGERSARQQEGEEAYDFPPFILQLCGDGEEEQSWLDRSNVNSGPRARVLALKLEACGYLCEFSDLDLVVSLPSRLRGESEAQQQGSYDDEPAGEGGFEGAGGGG
eukprot:TRINITY_DN21079_c1_g5_i1.p1 TRINITY_DN21079_c1_g5~~TRINITY_DN21079_c1_g5_i1.p1  ORF type:complete len:412 (+),score=105.59 TRINITY_DN21079_c1_g5_i1:70-1236(+)